MAAYNFQKQFAPLIRAGTKTQTIRPVGKRRHARPGEPIQLYTGMRTRACRKILTDDPVCLAVSPIALDFTAEPRIVVDGAAVEPSQLDAFARADGFASLDEMREFFVGQYDAVAENMLLIRWGMQA